MSDEIHLDKYPQETLMELTGAIASDKDEEQEALVQQVIAWQSFQAHSTKKAPTEKEPASSAQRDRRRDVASGKKQAQQ